MPQQFPEAKWRVPIPLMTLNIHTSACLTPLLCRLKLPPGLAQGHPRERTLRNLGPTNALLGLHAVLATCTTRLLRPSPTCREECWHCSAAYETRPASFPPKRHHKWIHAARRSIVDDASRNELDAGTQQRQDRCVRRFAATPSSFGAFAGWDRLGIHER